MKQNNPFEKVRKLFLKAKEISKKKGVCYVVRAGIIAIFDKAIGYYYYKKFKSSRTFTFQGKTYGYFCHKYNTTWKKERAVEVPIIWEMVEKYRNKKILETGNVLSHYFSVTHDILDKYEKANNVINQDIVDFQPSKKYDLIVSISTLEHVGWDEKPREPTKVLRAVENLKSLLAPKGIMIATLPLGYNPEMDKLLKDGKMQFTKQYGLKRISADNRWIETDWKDVLDVKYNSPFLNANGLIIGIIEKK